MSVNDETEYHDIHYEVEWTSLGEYLQHLEDRFVATNVASFVGAATVRIHEIGYEVEGRCIGPVHHDLDTAQCYGCRWYSGSRLRTHGFTGPNRSDYPAGRVRMC